VTDPKIARETTGTTGRGEPAPAMLELADGRRLAFHHHAGRTPGVLFCGGFTSDMTGTKARALETRCLAAGRSVTRFDYTGHGASSGRFADGTIGAWADDARQILDRVTAGTQIVVGSSMGGWIMLLLALARPARVAGLVGIAAAPDFTEDLIRARAGPAELAALERYGCWMQPSAYGDPPHPITRALLEDGRQHLVLRAPIGIRCPVHLLHGQQDPDVPYETSLRLAERLESDQVTIELIKAGDHRLSRDADIERLWAAVERLAGD
jgi:pimeloyl-ACP methyl ester carboxylesterase